MEYVCARCGCTSFHYNRRRMQMECDACGNPLRDPQQEQQFIQYTQTYSLAMNHLAAGNWERTITLLTPLLSQYPTEKKLYLAILRAATKDFEDFAMENAANKNMAARAWKKLDRLNGITQEMLRYSRQRHESYMKRLNEQKRHILTWIFAAGLCSIMAGIFLAGEYDSMVIINTCVLIFCLYKVFSYHPVKVMKQLAESEPDCHANPFV